ncbi:DUF4012 domain-containing protein [Candidatus Uhrbacteria bacterium]|nr:DUF4012 domain-containing protein [Candidatus Uhrbacteria bacterium]
MSQKRRSNWILILVAIVLAAMFVVVAQSTPHLIVAARSARAAERHLTTAVTTWRSEGYRNSAAITEDLQSARMNLARTQESLESLAFLRAIPVIRSSIAYGEEVAGGGALWLDGAAGLTRVAAFNLALIDRYADRAPIDLSSSERAAIVGALGSSLADARAAISMLDAGDRRLAAAACPRALRALRRCATGAIDRARTTAAPARASVLATIHTAERIVTLVGAYDPTEILILFLNNTELRPGGGFLGTYGLATIHRGELVDFRTDDVYNLDRLVEGTQRVLPPAPFRQHGIVSWWYLRDANWSPDFAASSRSVLDFYHREGGIGDPVLVVGFTPTFAQALLRIVGPIEVDGVRFDAENIADELEYQVEVGYHEKGIPRPQRKAIIAPLSRIAIDRLLARPIREWGPIMDALRVAARERQLLAYSRDPALQEFAERLELAGRVRPTAPGEDGLMVIDANLGSLKTDPVIERSIRYAIIPDRDGPDAPAGAGFRGAVRLRYRNTGTFMWKTTRYRTYTRVYLPAGTEFIGAHGAMIRDRSDEPGPVDVGTELGRTVIGAFLSIEPGSERSLSIEFRLAPAVSERIRVGSYVLRAQKQLGSIATPLTVDLEFGTPVKVADPPEPPAAWGNSRYSMETDLRVDRQFSVQLGR